MEAYGDALLELMRECGVTTAAAPPPAAGGAAAKSGVFVPVDFAVELP